MKALLLSFWLTGCILLAIVVLLPWPRGDVFTPGRNGFVEASIDSLHSSALFDLKSAHAATAGRYATGLFGNSRAIMVGCAHVGDCGAGSFFNFAVPGTSLRDWRILIEHLRDIDRQPDKIIISLDNFALEYQSAPTFPSFTKRASSLAEDVQRGASAVGVLRVAWRQVYAEWFLFRANLHLTSFKTRLGWLFGTAPQGDWRYLPDGSRPDAAAFQGGYLVTPIAQINLDILRLDLQRLADMRARGEIKQLVVYESPLHPDAQVGSSSGEALRQAFFAECERLDLRCLPAPRLAGNWSDVSHPPGPELGTWIAGTITPRMAGAR